MGKGSSLSADADCGGDAPECASASAWAETRNASAETGVRALFDDELDRLLPVGTVASVMRAAIPQEAKIGRDAREAAQDCASEFVAFVASEASDACAAAGSASASESTLCGPKRPEFGPETTHRLL